MRKVEEEIVRFSVSVPKEIFEFLEDYVSKTGYASRSELLRDLVRKEIIEEQWKGDKEVIGILALIYRHHERNVVENLLELQHSAYLNILSSLHIHLNEEECLEIIVIRGKPERIKSLEGQISGLFGVEFSRLIKAGEL